MLRIRYNTKAYSHVRASWHVIAYHLVRNRIYPTSACRIVSSFAHQIPHILQQQFN